MRYIVQVMIDGNIIDFARAPSYEDAMRIVLNELRGTMSAVLDTEPEKPTVWFSQTT